MARDWACVPGTLVCCPVFPACVCDVTVEMGFSESPGIGDGAAGVEGDGTTKGELADCKGVPVLGMDESRLCWSTCGEEFWVT